MQGIEDIFVKGVRVPARQMSAVAP